MQQSRNSFLHRLQPKALGLCVFLLLFGAQFLCFGYLYYQAFSNEQAHVRSEVGQLALIASEFVDVERHEQLTNPGQIDSAHYRELVEPLVRFHLASPGIHYLYTMRVDGEGNESFVLDTATDPKIEAMLLKLGRDVEASGLLETYEVPESANSEEVLAAMLSGQPYVYDQIYKDDYGSFVSAQAPIFDADGEYVGYLGVDYDLQAFDVRMDSLRQSGAITTLLALALSALLSHVAYKLRMESVTQLNLLSEKEEQVREEKERAEAAVLAKTDLLSLAVHDLKNPLFAIQGLADIILVDGESLSQEHQEHVETIYKASEGMSEVILGILQNEGLEHQGVQLDEDVDLSQLAESVVSFNTFNANKKSIAFEISLDPDLRVRGDMVRLREAMDNLVSNAVKYSPRGGRIRVALEASDSGKEVRFSVLDEGEGVIEADQAKLFKKFAKLTAKPTAGESSTGLGLSIVKTIVEKHGGTVGCQSEAGQGACFWIKLPLVAW